MKLTWLTGNILVAILLQIDENTAFTKVEENRENAESLSKGVIFQENSKFILAEKFVPVEFLIPFPRYNFTVKTDLEKLLKDLKNMWHQSSYFCPLNFSTNFQSNTTGFNFDWILQQIDAEVAIAKSEVRYLLNETEHFLEAIKNTVPNRKKKSSASYLSGIGGNRSFWRRNCFWIV